MVHLQTLSPRFSGLIVTSVHFPSHYRHKQRRGSSPDSIVPMGYAAYALEEQLRQDHAESLQEYAALQDQLLKRTQRAGTFLAGYLLLTVSGTVLPLLLCALLSCLRTNMQTAEITETQCDALSCYASWLRGATCMKGQKGLGAQAALATLVGTLASYAYLRWLMHDMAALSQRCVEPFQQARAQQSQPAQALLLGLAAYRHVLFPLHIVTHGAVPALQIRPCSAQMHC